MTNAERLLLNVLPRWAGVTVISIKEPLSDMWISGEQAGHHVDMRYDAQGIERLRRELLKDFVHAPAADAFGAAGSLQTIRDLVLAMADVGQRPVPSTSAMLALLLPSKEVAKLTGSCSRKVDPHREKETTRLIRNRGSYSARVRKSASKARNYHAILFINGVSAAVRSEARTRADLLGIGRILLCRCGREGFIKDAHIWSSAVYIRYPTTFGPMSGYGRMVPSRSFSSVETSFHVPTTRLRTERCSAGGRCACVKEDDNKTNATTACAIFIRR